MLLLPDIIGMSSDNTTRMSCVRRTEEIEEVNVTAYGGISFRNLSHTLEFIPENFVVLLVHCTYRNCPGKVFLY